jgi:hypothetical protein
MVTHSVEVAQHAPRIVNMADGRVVSDGASARPAMVGAAR